MASKRIEKFFNDQAGKSSTNLKVIDTLVLLDSDDKTDIEGSNIPKVKRVTLEAVRSLVGISSDGADEQILAKDGSAPYETKWVDKPVGIPQGGTDGQILAKDGDNNYEVTWVDKPVDGINGEGVPAGGDEGDFLIKKTSTNYDAEWKTLGKRYEKISIPIEYTEGAEIDIRPVYGNNPFIRGAILPTQNVRTWEFPIPHNMDTSKPIRVRLRGVTTKDCSQTSEPGGFDAKFAMYRRMPGDTTSNNPLDSIAIDDIIFETNYKAERYFTTEWSGPFTIQTEDVNPLPPITADDLIQMWLYVDSYLIPAGAGGEIPFIIFAIEILYEEKVIIWEDN